MSGGNSPTNIQLALTDINGGSLVDGNGLDIQSWNWGARNKTKNTDSGLSAGTPDVDEMRFNKEYCAGSPILMKYLMEGKHFQTAVLTMKKSVGSDKPEVYFTVTLTNVYVTEYCKGGHNGDDAVGESFSLNYETIKIEYKPQKTEDGSLGPAIDFGWDKLKNVAC